MRTVLEQEHDRSRRRRHELGSTSERQMALVHRMRAVHVFMRRNRVGDRANRQSRRQWLLQHHAVYRRIFAELAQRVADVANARRFGKSTDVDVDAGVGASFRKRANVGATGIVFADEDDGKARMNSGVEERSRGE